MSDPSDELQAIKQELEQFRQDFGRFQKGLGNQIAVGIISGSILLAVILFVLQILGEIVG